MLSQPEQKGEQAYKRVVKTYRHEDKEVFSVNFLVKSDLDERGWEIVLVTGSHPFWVKGEGWRRADRLDEGSVLELADGTEVKAFGIRPVFASDSAGVAWVPNVLGGTDRDDEIGQLVDLRSGKPTIDYLTADLPGVGAFAEHFKISYGRDRLKVPVYNIEVEDFHTYYVGKTGVWVHNIACGEDREFGQRVPRRQSSARPRVTPGSDGTSVPGFSPVVVTVHGSVSVNADGSFTYVPGKDYAPPGLR